MATGLAFTINFQREYLLGFGIFFGYFANIFAVVISIIVFSILIVRHFKGQGKLFFDCNWLGIFNGVFVIVFWIAVFGIIKIIS